MRILNIVLPILLILALFQPAYSWEGLFNGERKGFILGFGTGFGSLNFTQEMSYRGSSTSASDSHLPLITNFKIGGGITSQLLLYWSAKVSWFSMDNTLNETVTITAGTGAVALSYYWKPQAPGWFVSSGLGYSSWDTPFEDEGKTWTGTGLFLGGGYEFNKYWNVEGGMNWGNPSTTESGIEATTTHSTFFVTINVLGY